MQSMAKYTKKNDRNNFLQQEMHACSKYVVGLYNDSKPSITVKKTVNFDIGKDGENPMNKL